jgi:exosortase A
MAATLPQLQPQPDDARPALPWARLAPGALLIAALLLLFRDTAAAMVDIWWRSETFTHCFLVPPISLWLVWRRRHRLAQLPSRPVPWLLLFIAGACALWLLGELASVNAATQLALVALIVLAVPAVYGWAVARELAFPLAFLFFAVPLGEFLVPVMMEWTADFTVAALQATGLPVYREGLQFIIPSGSWSVIEACSGVRYLIASFMVGTLFAYLNFNGLKKRLVFALVSIAVPVLANWLRAYIIVMLGHLSNNQIAAGVDHLIYGWVFFGIVIGAMFMIGARWADPESGLPPPWVPAWASATPGALWGSSAAVLALLLATQGLLWQLGQPSGSTPALQLPAPATGWAAAPVDNRPGRWQPQYKTGNLQLEAAVLPNSGSDTRAVGLWLGYYRDQAYDRKLVTSTNSLVEASGTGQWAQVASGGVRAPDGTPWRSAVLRGANDPAALGAPRLRVWQVYWVGGHYLASDVRAKLQLAINRLLGRGDDGAVLILYTALPADASAEALAAADALLARYLQAHAGALDASLQAAQASR